MNNIVFCSIFLVMDHTGISYNHRVRGYIKVDECSGGDKYVVAYRDISNHGTVYTYVDTIAKCGDTRSLTSVFSAYGTTLMQICIFAYLNPTGYGYIVRVAKV